MPPPTSSPGFPFSLSSSWSARTCTGGCQAGRVDGEIMLQLLKQQRICYSSISLLHRKYTGCLVEDMLSTVDCDEALCAKQIVLNACESTNSVFWRIHVYTLSSGPFLPRAGVWLSLAEKLQTRGNSSSGNLTVTPRDGSVPSRERFGTTYEAYEMFRGSDRCTEMCDFTRFL